MKQKKKTKKTEEKFEWSKKCDSLRNYVLRQKNQKYGGLVLNNTRKCVYTIRLNI